MPALKKGTIFPTDEEDKLITKQAVEDDTNWSDDELKQFTSVSDFPEIKKLRGRPKSDNPKQAVSIRFSSEVLEYFKATGKGWQTRMDEVLRKYVSTH